MSREAFEKWAREKYVCGEHSFVRAHPYGYINTVHSDTFGGRVQPNYADVQMLWETWQASSRESESLLRRAMEALDWAEDHVPRDGTPRHKFITETLAALRQHLEPTPDTKGKA